MGSFFEINDTLQISRAQGFPKELDLQKHLKKPFKASQFKDKIFSFKNKKDIRIFQSPPCRNFFVERTSDGKWIYWGLVHILEVTHDYKKRTTAGRFKIININTPEQMKQAHKIIDRDHDTSYFT